MALTPIASKRRPAVSRSHSRWSALGGAQALPDDVYPRAILDTDAGLMLGGRTRVNPGDLWLGRLGADEAVETLATEDHAELADAIIALERSGEVIGALSSVGLINRGEGDQPQSTVEGTMLTEYDLSGTKLRQTLLADDEEVISWVPRDLAAPNSSMRTTSSLYSPARSIRLGGSSRTRP